ncbi:hypothetical protein HS5_03550 [Acidianus sp. HS-5]|nr:hypothetical protein HS5_03550 [Acidianus sp. HS-5]
MFEKISYYKKAYSNWISVVLAKLRKEKMIKAKLRHDGEGICTSPCIAAIPYLLAKGFDVSKFHFKDGKLYYENNEIIQDSWLLAILSACGFVKADGIFYNNRYNVKFKVVLLSVFEVFCLKSYNVEVNGREVVDVGANIGDSTLWFALKGAKHVYSFEPLPSVYSLAVENIKLNNIEDKVTLINAAVGSKDGEIAVSSNVKLEESLTYTSVGKGNVKVPVYSLERISEMINDPYLLKMDCEGCEADIILNSQLDFEKIVFEAHERKTGIKNKKLISKLEGEKYRCERREKTAKGVEVFYCEKTV